MDAIATRRKRRNFIPKTLRFNQDMMKRWHPSQFALCVVSGLKCVTPLGDYPVNGTAKIGEVDGQHQPRPAAAHSIFGIEILRFVCAFGVLLWHYQHFAFIGGDAVAGAEAIRKTLPLYPLLSVFYENGSLAVEFFWAISGFIFYWYYADEVHRHAVSFFEFGLRRFSRLYPLHCVTLLFVAGAQYLYYSSHQTTFVYLWNKPIWFVAHLLFAANWFSVEPTTFNGPIWSVSIEILIYLLFFAIARMLSPSFLTAGIASIACWLLFQWPLPYLNPEVLACGMYFFAGGAAQRLSGYPVALPIAGAVAVATLAALTLHLVDPSSIALVLLAAATVVFFAKLGQTNLFGSPLRRVAFLGNLTYSSYLLHFPIQITLVLICDALGLSRTIFLSPIALVAFLTLVFGLGAVVYLHFELPAQKWIRRKTAVIHPNPAISKLVPRTESAKG